MLALRDCSCAGSYTNWFLLQFPQHTLHAGENLSPLVGFSLVVRVLKRRLQLPQLFVQLEVNWRGAINTCLHMCSDAPSEHCNTATIWQMHREMVLELDAPQDHAGKRKVLNRLAYKHDNDCACWPEDCHPKISVHLPIWLSYHIIAMPQVHTFDQKIQTVRRFA